MKRTTLFNQIAELVYDTVRPRDCIDVDDSLVLAVRCRGRVLEIIPTGSDERPRRTLQARLAVAGYIVVLARSAGQVKRLLDQHYAAAPIAKMFTPYLLIKGREPSPHPVRCDVWRVAA